MLPLVLQGKVLPLPFLLLLRLSLLGSVTSTEGFFGLFHLHSGLFPFFFFLLGFKLFLFLKLGLPRMQVGRFCDQVRCVRIRLHIR